ncbi:MAG: hypothetical protein IJK41_04355 [Muribaculaceae bacterium]|nr:hypothetical protein [Muribaculaceae bacterium]
MILTINGKLAALKKGSSIEYVSENRIFTDADDYSMEIELPLADCPQEPRSLQAPDPQGCRYRLHHLRCSFFLRNSEAPLAGNTG